MPVDLSGRSVLTLKDFSPDEIRHLLSLAAALKRARLAGSERPHLKGKSIALIFEKTSTRTRIGFEVAAYEQGAHVTYLGPAGTQIGYKETIKDTARVLGRVYHAIEYRGAAQRNVEILAAHAGVPVYNGLTDEFHPTQVLADLLTIEEHGGRPLSETTLCFVGNGHSNVADSLLIGGAKMGLEVRLCAPRPLWPDEGVRAAAEEIASETGARLSFGDDVAEAVRGTDFLYTDVWLSMGEPREKWPERIALLRPYQIDAAMLALTGNDSVRVMHCLPAFHNAETEIGAAIRAQHGLEAMEITEEVFESPASIVFDQAENRLHTIKAVLVATLGEGNAPS